MGGSSAPRDNSDKVAQIEAAAAREARAAADAERIRAQQEFDARMNAAFGGGISSANQFFADRGLDPSQYGAQITNRANQVRTSVPNLASDPGTYFSSLGENVYNELTQAQRNQALRGINTVAPTGFETGRIANTADDEIINAILAEQEANANQYIQNLLDRGVISQSGYSSALKNLQGQRPGAQSRLSEVGTGILESGRGEAGNLANAARSRASALELGEAFDPYATGTQLNQFFTDFFTNLGGKLRGAAPTNLFDTSGLANIAGAAQGAGNRPFDPAAVAGIFGPEEEEEEENQTTNPF
jgi:hypothetical protein